jgi:hypothetical protein
LVFVGEFHILSSFIFTTSNLYLNNTHLEGASIEMHNVLTLWRIFRPSIFMISINMVCSRCILKMNKIHVHWSKQGINLCSKWQVRQSLYNKLHMQWMFILNGACFYVIWIVKLVFKPWETITPSTAKYTNFNVKSPFVSTPNSKILKL